jgi:hypothetical protein
MNTLTTKDVAQVAMTRKPAYDFFNVSWPISSVAKPDAGDNPVANFGLGGVRTSRRAQGFGELGAVRTSRRSAGFGDMLGMGFLDTQVMGIPLWGIAAGLVGLMVVLPALKKKK